jgi:hypothetical protein
VRSLDAGDGLPRTVASFNIGKNRASAAAFLPGWRRAKDVLKIAGLTPFTTIDYPDHLAAVLLPRLLRGGLPLQLSLFRDALAISLDKVLTFLESRRGS